MISASYKNLEKYTSNLKNIAMETLNKASGMKQTTNASNNAKDTAVMLTLSSQGEQKRTLFYKNIID